MAEISKQRKKIDEIDDQILSALCERVKICKKIGNAKKKHGIPIRDLSRESEIFKSIKEKSARIGLNTVQVELVYREIVNMCSAVQE
ncbi:MAG TPA: chorismate mutase [Acidobacteriota bacterium]|nr:chorismate mutase [Acidobacteriota bacterium]